MTAPYTELDKPLDEYSVVCRGCLAESGEMKNIFEWGLAEDFYMVTNIQVSKLDNMSELLCTACESALATCQRFLQQCKDCDLLLRTKVKDKAQTTQPESQFSQENRINSVLLEKKLIYMITAPDANSKIYLTCPHCENKYMKQRDLLLHLSKNHSVDPDEFTIKLQYYCSYFNCSYQINANSNKYFHSRKYLNQHRTKVHMTKSWQCNICSLKFATEVDLNRHLKTCNITYACDLCDIKYNTNEKLLVHLMRKHPDLHKQYKEQRKTLRLISKSSMEPEPKKSKIDDTFDFFDSPKRSFATQTLKPDDNIRNDVTLPSWTCLSLKDAYETKTDEISTQTVFEDLLSLRSHTSEDESIFFSETVSLSDIQTQTFPLEFGLSRSNKETITSGTQSPDWSIKETQTCFCLYDSPKPRLGDTRLFEGIPASGISINHTSTETQTIENRSSVKSDVLLSLNTAETQTSFEEILDQNHIL